MMPIKRFASVLCIAIILLVACSTSDTTTESTLDLTNEPELAEAESQSVAQDTPESRGQVLFVQSIDEVGFACASCHHLTDARLIGPGMGNLSGRFEDYQLEMSFEDYLAESIINPHDYIVEAEPAYPANVMPDTYQNIFTEEQINDLVAYILSLQT